MSVKILVTGGAGFIGRWLLRELPASAEVVVVDALLDEVHGPGAGFPPDVAARAACVHCNVRDTGRWRDRVRGVDVVVHLASLTATTRSLYQQRRYVRENVEATAALCEVLQAMPQPPRRVVLASSRAVYGEGAYRQGRRVVYPGPRSPRRLARGEWDLTSAAGERLLPVPVREAAPLRPASWYGMTKVWQEQMLALAASTAGVESIALRFQNVYGPLQSLKNAYAGVLGVVAKGVVRDGRVELFEDGRMSRDFVYVRDAAQALASAILSEKSQRGVVNVGSGVAVTLADLVALVAEHAGRTPEVTCSGRFRLGDIRHACADMRMYEARVGAWRPTRLADGLRAYLDWFREEPDEPACAVSTSFTEMVEAGALLEADRST